MRTIHRLQKFKIDRLTKRGRYPDGNGLYLQISESGSRSWLFRYARDGEERKMGLGPLHTVSLSEARNRTRILRQMLIEGIDPLAEKKKRRAEERAQAARSMTFRAAAEQYIADHASTWKNEKHRDQWTSTLENHAYPVIGEISVADIKTAHILKIIQPLWADKRETANRIRGRIERILDAATAREFRTGANPARWQGHLKKLLPVSKTKIQKHHPAMPYREVPGFMVELRELESISSYALEFVVLTAARTNEVIGAKPSEIDEAEKVWTVPAERMKSGRSHRVPLSDRAEEIWKLMKGKGGEFIFPSSKVSMPLSNMALLECLRGLRDGLTVHGFRSSFRDWTKEQTNYSHEVAELALAHVVSDKTEAAYSRGDALDKRRRLMRDWSKYCSANFGTAEIVPIRGRA